MIALLALVGIVLYVLAGANVRGPRFAPEWYATACIAAAFFWPHLTTIAD